MGYDRLIAEQEGEMGHRRFKVLGGQPFYGDLVYERAVPQDHFLRQLDALGRG